MRILLVVGIVTLAVAALVATPVAASVQVTVVASGLDSPRGVATRNGNVLVAEAGHGGDVCIPVGPPFGTNCLGLTSQISVVNPKTGQHHPLVSGLFSSLLAGSEAIGVSGIATREGKVLGILGEYPQEFESLTCDSTMPADCAAVKAAALAEAGRLISVAPNGKWTSIASVGAFGFNFTATIPHQEHDANPFGVLSGENILVADAGSNTLNSVSESGQIKVLQYFHFEPAGSFPTDAVPTCVVRAKGHLWVADLSGRLFRLDGSTATQINVVDSSGNPVLRHVTGCTTGAGDGGAIYLVNMWTTPAFPSPNTGSVVRYNLDGGTASVVADTLNFPNMIAIGPRHSLYVSANSVCPAPGGPAECSFMGQTSGLLLKISPGTDEGDDH